MSFISDLLGDITGANDQADAARVASQIQAGASEAGIAEMRRASEAGLGETRRQFDSLVRLMSPYVNAGLPALNAQEDLLGLNGKSAQGAAIQGIEGSPQFGALVKQGENALLQNASATGGLRGGNIQSALAQFRPSILSGLIDQQFSRLGGITQIGQASAAGQASAGMNAGSSISNIYGQQGANIANLLAQQGAANAGGVLAQGGAGRQAFGDLLKIGGVVGGFF